MMSCIQMAATVKRESVVRRGRIDRLTTASGSCTQLRLVKKAMLTIKQKNVCPSVACAVLMAGGR